MAANRLAIVLEGIRSHHRRIPEQIARHLAVDEVMRTAGPGSTVDTGSLPKLSRRARRLDQGWTLGYIQRQFGGRSRSGSTRAKKRVTAGHSRGYLGSPELRARGQDTRDSWNRW